jgi:hypothetical protein
MKQMNGCGIRREGIGRRQLEGGRKRLEGTTRGSMLDDAMRKGHNYPTTIISSSSTSILFLLLIPPPPPSNRLLRIFFHPHLHGETFFFQSPQSKSKAHSTSSQQVAHTHP